MSEREYLNDPTNRIVCIFKQREAADEARAELADRGVPNDHVRVFKGEAKAGDVDATSKWFADTHRDIERYQRALDEGQTVMSIPVEDSETREKLHRILKQHGAHLITHFGEWITETMK